jgi:hypothetical protein
MDGGFLNQSRSGEAKENNATEQKSKRDEERSSQLNAQGSGNSKRSPNNPNAPARIT